MCLAWRRSANICQPGRRLVSQGARSAPLLGPGAPRAPAHECCPLFISHGPAAHDAGWLGRCACTSNVDKFGAKTKKSLSTVGSFNHTPISLSFRHMKPDGASLGEGKGYPVHWGGGKQRGLPQKVVRPPSSPRTNLALRCPCPLRSAYAAAVSRAGKAHPRLPGVREVGHGGFGLAHAHTNAGCGCWPRRHPGLSPGIAARAGQGPRASAGSATALMPAAMSCPAQVPFKRRCDSCARWHLLPGFTVVGAPKDDEKIAAGAKKDAAHDAALAAHEDHEGKRQEPLTFSEIDKINVARLHNPLDNFDSISASKERDCHICLTTHSSLWHLHLDLPFLLCGSAQVMPAMKSPLAVCSV